MNDKLIDAIYEVFRSMMFNHSDITQKRIREFIIEYDKYWLERESQRKLDEMFYSSKTLADDEC